jgi:uncharacterized membrane protein YedE/YeeE
MKTWFWVFVGVILEYPLLYQGYVAPEEKQMWASAKFGVSIGWILLFICICVLVLVLILFWRGERSHNESKNITH